MCAWFAGKKRSRRGKLVQMTTLKPRGAEGGPKRTPPHLGDAWQNKTAYEVEEVCLFNFSKFRKQISPYVSCVKGDVSVVVK